MLQYCAKTEVDLFLSLCMNTIAWFCHLVTFKWFFHSINYDFFTKLDEWFWILLINDTFSVCLNDWHFTRKQTNTSYIYLPTCWVDLSWNSNIILVFFVCLLCSEPSEKFRVKSSFIYFYFFFGIKKLLYSY